jgi:hypothetical protein
MKERPEKPEAENREPSAFPLLDFNKDRRNQRNVRERFDRFTGSWMSTEDEAGQ